MNNLKVAFWGGWLLISLLLLMILLGSNKLMTGGDVVEYYGMTEALINHRSLDIRESDITNLKNMFEPSAVDNPEYFLVANNGNRYATHFWFYSWLLLPFRILFGLKSFGVLNWLLFTAVNALILSKYISSLSNKLLYVFLVYFSPLVYFLPWTGIEIYMMSLLMLGLFVFFDKNSRWLGITLMGVASWQSLPLVLVPIFFGLVDLILSIKSKQLTLSWLIKRVMLGLIVLLPNIYFFYLFGTYHAQAKLPGMGLSVNWYRVYEVMFDLNIGLLWYWPITFVLGWWALKKKWWLLIPIILTELIYSATTNWNHGTAGFGPSRYGLLFIPFWVWLTLKYHSNELKKLMMIYLPIQLLIITLNGGLLPSPNSSFELNSVAKWTLDRFPNIYNPTSDVFVKRTGGVGVYKNEMGVCKKAIVYKWNEESLMRVETECRVGIDKNLIRDRKVSLRQGSLWPEGSTCTGPGNNCLKDVEIVSGLLKIDQNRLEPIAITYGAWRIKIGSMVNISIPEGYMINYDPLDGVYINF